MSAQWSKEIPKEPGWYWVRSVTKQEPIPLFNEPERDFQGHVFAKMAAYDYYGAGYGHRGYECFGPIPLPPTD